MSAELENTFQLGPRTFTIAPLSYDNYVSLMGHLQPFLDALITKHSGISVPDIEIIPSTLNANVLFEFASSSLPEMVRIICNDKKITVEDVKLWGEQPFALAEIVVRQVAVSGMIGQVANFVQRLLPVLTRMGLAQIHSAA